MKKILGFILSSVLLVSCSQKNKEETVLKTVFEVNRFDVPKDEMDMTLKIINSSQSSLKGGAWSLHWNQIIGVIDVSTLAEGIKFTSVNGQQYLILDFGENYTLKSKDTLVINYTQKGVIQREVMGPLGVFIRDKARDKTYGVISELVWENAEGIEGLNQPTAEDKYLTHQSQSLLPKNEIGWIVPSPKEINVKGQNRPSIKKAMIYLPEKYISLQNVITYYFEKSDQFQVSFVSKEEANILVSENESLGLEAYHLNIEPDGVNIAGSNKKGIFYAFQSLLQVFLTAELEMPGNLPLMEVRDAPRFSYRGHLLDIGRNFYGPKKIKQMLDYMALFKINHLDFRLTDDEAWRLEIPGLPELTEIGANRGFTEDESDRLIPFYGSGKDGIPRGSGYLSKDDFVEILKYAAERQIQIIPQISFPSHARAAIKSMEVRYKRFMDKGDQVNAEKYLLNDFNDKSVYRSAQLFNDNVICICRESAYTFFEKVVDEIKSMYGRADVELTSFHIGADELPYGVWKGSPVCDDFISQNEAISNVNELYDQNVFRLNRILNERGAVLVGWEDVLLKHSSQSQEETEIKMNFVGSEIIPYVWNNIWGGGREDMIYKFANLGFKAVMSNSSAFYFDMSDDRDFENFGLNWSGFVTYKDTWSTEPLNVFLNPFALEANNISEAFLNSIETLKPEAVKNFIGVQSQLWTETVINADIFDELMMPNLPLFSEKAWGKAELWTQVKDIEKRKESLNKGWNTFANTIGQRTLPIITTLFKEIKYDLPKPGGIIENGELKVKTVFPGLIIKYTTDGSTPSQESSTYKESVAVDPKKDKIVLRAFDVQGRGGRPIKLN